MKKLGIKEWLAVAVAVVVVLFIFLFNADFFSKSGATNLQSVSSVKEEKVSSQMIKSQDLTAKDTRVGTGAEAKSGSQVSVSYVGKFADDTVFDASAADRPFTFVLGAGFVIPGWDLGLVGMKVGGKRTLVIPPSLAYGSRGIVHPATGEVIIPPNATLTFEVELLSVQ